MFALSTIIIDNYTDQIFLATLCLMVLDCISVDLVILGQMAMVHGNSSKILEISKWNKKFW